MNYIKRLRFVPLYLGLCQNIQVYLYPNQKIPTWRVKRAKRTSNVNFMYTLLTFHRKFLRLCLEKHNKTAPHKKHSFRKNRNINIDATTKILQSIFFPTNRHNILSIKLTNTHNFKNIKMQVTIRVLRNIKLYTVYV